MRIQAWNAFCLISPVKTREHSMRPILIVLGCMLIAGLMVACMNGKSAENTAVEKMEDKVEASSEDQKEKPRDYAAEGYLPVTVDINDTRAEVCKVLLKQDGTEVTWEPMGLDIRFEENGMKLWVKVQAQRRKSECGGMPCAILEQEKREP